MGNHKESPHTKEKREYIRTDTSVPLTLYIKSGDITSEVKSFTRNVSATGMMVEVEQELVTGTDVKLEVVTPSSSNPVHCNGTIVWSSPISKTGRFSTGIEFTKIEEDNKNTFLKFLCDTIYRASNQ